jgi:hypothetical protein
MAKVKFEDSKAKKKADASPFAAATDLGVRAKLFMWGATGTKKTITAIQFPSPIVIDLEGGTDRYGSSFKFHKPKTPPKSFEEVKDLVLYLFKNKHPYRTLVIDPITILWEMLQKKWSAIFLKRNKGAKGFKGEFYDFQPRDWQTIKADWKGFIRLLQVLDMNIVITAREKPLYAEGEMMKKIGVTHDAEKNLPYEFDTVLQLKRDGDDFGAEVHKDRTNNLKEGSNIAGFTYATVEKAFGKKALARKPKPPEKQQAAFEETEEGLKMKAEEDGKAALKGEKPTVVKNIDKDRRANIVEILRRRRASPEQVQKSLERRFQKFKLIDLTSDELETLESVLSI